MDKGQAGRPDVPVQPSQGPSGDIHCHQIPWLRVPDLRVVQVPRQWEFLHCPAHQLALANKTNEQAWLAVQDQLQPLQDQIEHIYRDAQVQLGVTAPPPEAGGIAPGASQHLYNMVSDNTPIFMPEPNEDEIQSCMDFMYDWITERHRHKTHGAFKALAGTGAIYGRLLQQDV